MAAPGHAHIASAAVSRNCGRDEASRQQRIDRNRSWAPDDDPAQQNRPIKVERADSPSRAMQRRRASNRSGKALQML